MNVQFDRLWHMNMSYCPSLARQKQDVLHSRSLMLLRQMLSKAVTQLPPGNDFWRSMHPLQLLQDLTCITNSLSVCLRMHKMTQMLGFLLWKIWAIIGSWGNVSEEDILEHALNNVPKEYEVTVTKVEHWLESMDDPLTIEELWEQLNLSMSTWVLREQSPNLAIAHCPIFFDGFKGKCQTCGKWGHKSCVCHVKSEKGKVITSTCCLNLFWILFLLQEERG